MYILYVCKRLNVAYHVGRGKRAPGQQRSLVQKLGRGGEGFRRRNVRYAIRYVGIHIYMLLYHRAAYWVLCQRNVLTSERSALSVLRFPP